MNVIDGLILILEPVWVGNDDFDFLFSAKAFSYFFGSSSDSNGCSSGSGSDGMSLSVGNEAEN